MLLMYNYALLKMSTWYSKHVEESNNIWRINNIQCITLVVLYGQFMMHGQRNIKLFPSATCPVYLTRRILRSNPCLHSQARATNFVRHVRAMEFDGLTIWRLTATIWVLPHSSPPDAAFYIFIQPTDVLNILNMLHNLRFFLFKMPFIS